MTTGFTPTQYELEALALLFDLAEGFGGGSRRARSLLCAWWNGAELGGFDLADFWSLDEKHTAAALTVISLIARAPQGTYADAIDGFGDRMKALAQRRAAELKPIIYPEPHR